MRNKATASSVYASGQVSAGNMPQKLATVNIYDVRIKDRGGEFFRHQQHEPAVHFSVIGAKAATWEKYRDRMFTGRDDGMLRVAIDASQARLLPIMKPESEYKNKAQRAMRLEMITQSSMAFGKALEESASWHKLRKSVRICTTGKLALMMRSDLEGRSKEN